MKNTLEINSLKEIFDSLVIQYSEGVEPEIIIIQNNPYSLVKLLIGKDMKSYRCYVGFRQKSKGGQVLKVWISKPLDNQSNDSIESSAIIKLQTFSEGDNAYNRFGLVVNYKVGIVTDYTFSSFNAITSSVQNAISLCMFTKTK